MNVGITVSKGEYIAYLDDDNEYYPFHLEILQRKLENSPNIDIAYCDMVIEFEGAPEKGLVPGIAINFDSQFLLNRNYIDTSEVMHRREIIFNVGGWDEEIKRFTDWNLWVRMLKWGAKFERVPIAALKYNAHNGETQSSKTKVRSWVDGRTGMTMFEPTFDPAGCKIFLPYLGENKKETDPKVAIFTLSYDRLDYTKRMWKTLQTSTEYPFDWFVLDQGSKDGSAEWLKNKVA